MTTPAHHLIQDQNLNILYNGASLGGKNDVAKTDKKGVGGRKALNDISNSRKPSVLKSTKSDNSTNVVSIGKDLCAASTATTNIGGKAKFSKATEKGKDGGRKALSDLTNSVRPSSQRVPRTGRKLFAVAEENVPSSVVEERFLHNHQECIKAQMKAVDLDFFMKSVGLDNDIPVKLSATRKSSSKKKPVKYLEMEEMTEQPFEDQGLKFWKSELSGYCSPTCLSPKLENFPYLMLIESPKLMNP